jgi:arylsulfatase
MKPLLLLVCVLVLFGCGGGGQPPVVRLVDEFDADSVQGAPTSKAPEPQALWNFSEPGEADSPLLGWKAGIGVSGLTVVDGKLTGRTTSATPIIYAMRPDTVDGSDLFHSLEVKARTSAAAEIRAHLEPPPRPPAPPGQPKPPSNSEEPDFKKLAAAENFNWLMEGRLDGDWVQSVTLTQAQVRSLGGVKMILLRPASAAGVTFEIESVRLISQREHRASIPSGVGWQGLGEIFRETVVSRSPESFVVDFDIPPNARLDMHLGTVEESAVTFRIDDVTGEDVTGEEKTPILERTITTPQRWESATVDLSRLAGRKSLRFSLDVEQERLIGFWGSAAIRSRAAPAASSQPVAGASEPPQGVILIMIDTLRRDHLDAYGYERETAPNMARMAAGGALFLDNISQAAWTKVSTPSIMTSLYPQSHRVQKVPDRLSAAAVTVAEVYRDAGYATAAFCSNPFTGRFTNLHQGFEEMHEHGSLSGTDGTKTARPVVDRVIGWLEKRPKTPYFLFLHLYDPHSDFEPRAPYNTMWSEAPGKEAHEEQRKAALDAAKKKGEDRPFNELPFPEDFEGAGLDAKAWIQYEKGWYDGSIRGMDAEIGRLTERLRTLGLEGDTLIGIVADHGEELHEHRKMGHGHTAYGEIANVPLILYRPGAIPAGVRVEETTRSIDLMPTLLASSGLPIPGNAQGQSLLPLVTASQEANGEGAREAAAALGWESRPAVTEEHARDDKDDESYALVFEGWKLIHNVKTKDKPEFELFDHRADPLDATNVAEQHPDRIKELRAKLAAWREMVTAARLPDEESAEGMSSEEITRLRSLGYIQ